MRWKVSRFRSPFARSSLSRCKRKTRRAGTFVLSAAESFRIWSSASNQWVSAEHLRKGQENGDTTSLFFWNLGPRDKTEKRFSRTVGKELFQSLKPTSIDWPLMAAVTISEVGVRIGCPAHLVPRWQEAHHAECSTTMPNHHTSGRIITSAVHHTSANNFISAHLSRSAATAQHWVFKWSWHVLDSLHYHGWPWWVTGVSKTPPPPKKK